MKMFWKASARADINPDGINYKPFSKKELKRINSQAQIRGYKLCNLAAVISGAMLALAVSVELSNIPDKNIWRASGVLALSTLVQNVRIINLNKKKKKDCSSAVNRADNIFAPLNDHGYSVNDFKTTLTDAFALIEFYGNDGKGQPYADSFNQQAGRQAEYISIGQFTQDLRADSQIERFVKCLKLAQTLSSDRQEKQSALNECNRLIQQPEFRQKLAGHMLSGNVSDDDRESIINSNYASLLQDEIYNLCRNALVTLAVVNSDSDIGGKINEYSANKEPAEILGEFIVRCDGIGSGLASRLEQEIGLNIITKMQESNSYSLSDDQVAAVTAWSENRANRSGSEMANGIGSLPPVMPIFPAINPSREQAR